MMFKSYDDEETLKPFFPGVEGAVCIYFGSHIALEIHLYDWSEIMNEFLKTITTAVRKKHAEVVLHTHMKLQMTGRHFLKKKSCSKLTLQ